MTRSDHTQLRKIDRRQLVAGAAGLGLAAPFLGGDLRALAAPSRQDATPTPTSGGILKVGLQADPTALDPQKQSLTAIWHVIEHIYNGLTRITKPDLTVEPGLAEGWEISEDGTSYMFVLREGVTFHDGTPLKASDVKFTFERLVDPETASTSASELASMESIEATDDRTVVMTLNAPDASFLATLAAARARHLLRSVRQGKQQRRLSGGDGHRALQVRRVRAEHPHRSGAERELLGRGAALSRWHRDDDCLRRYVAHRGGRHWHGRFHRVRPAARRRQRCSRIRTSTSPAIPIPTSASSAST